MPMCRRELAVLSRQTVWQPELGSWHEGVGSGLAPNPLRAHPAGAGILGLGSNRFGVVADFLR